MFCSQQGEDLYILKNYINKPVTDGRFVEIGAVDGFRYSNTLFFEQKFGYKGMLVEPQKYMFEYLQQNRGDNILINKVVSNTEGNVSFIGDTPCGGIEKYMSEKSKNSWHKNSKTTILETTRFDTLFELYNYDYIDIFSLDVEGGELDVLNTIDFIKTEIYIMCIELDGNDLEKDEQCRELLRNHGFTFHKKMFINEFWVNEKYSRKELLFDREIPFNFSSINKKTKNNNLGTYPFIEYHLIDDINDEFNR
jgi:FkbM family methyltransferase